jgi:large subunit ribosomal protein L15
VSKVSKSAIEGIEKVGGRVKSVYYNRLGLRVLLKPEKFHPALVPRRARPVPKDMPYYTNYENRGEFSPEIQMMEIEARQQQENE